MESREEAMKQTILDIRDLTVSFTRYEERTSKRTDLPVISNLNVAVREGELVAVVGSSGSGKSLLAHAVMGLLPQNATATADMYYRGARLGAEDIARLRGDKLALVPQSINYLDPLMKVGMQITNGKRDAASLSKMRGLCKRYGFDERVEQLYPFELSGGMARRVLLMTALMREPKLVIADEPTPGMEPALARRVMADFRSFANGGGGVLLITHDLKLALEVADRIVVFYAGTTVEEARAIDFAQEDGLRHPYTRALWRAMPEHGFLAETGTQPYVKEIPQGCPFAPRCAYRKDACGGEIPVYAVREGSVRCLLYAPGNEKEVHHEA